MTPQQVAEPADTAEVKVKRMHTYPEAQIQHQSLGPVRIYEAAQGPYWRGQP